MDEFIRRAEAVNFLREEAHSYTVSQFATSGECWVARTVLQLAAATIADMPTLDVAPVRHGRWVHLGPNYYECTSCKETTSIFSGTKKYCPNCGAKMNGEER